MRSKIYRSSWVLLPRALAAIMVASILQGCNLRIAAPVSVTDIGTLVSVSSSDGGSRLHAAMLLETTMGYYPVRGQRVFTKQEALALLAFDNGERWVCNVAKDQCMELLAILH
jgi:hypothetical protein